MTWREKLAEAVRFGKRVLARVKKMLRIAGNAVQAGAMAADTVVRRHLSPSDESSLIVSLEELEPLASPPAAAQPPAPPVPQPRLIDLYHPDQNDLHRIVASGEARTIDYVLATLSQRRAARQNEISCLDGTERAIVGDIFKHFNETRDYTGIGVLVQDKLRWEEVGKNLEQVPCVTSAEVRGIAGAIKGDTLRQKFMDLTLAHTVIRMRHAAEGQPEAGVRDRALALIVSFKEAGANIAAASHLPMRLAATDQDMELLCLLRDQGADPQEARKYAAPHGEETPATQGLNTFIAEFPAESPRTQEMVQNVKRRIFGKGTAP